MPVYKDIAKRIGILSSERTKVATCSGVVLFVNEMSPMNGISINCSWGVDPQRHGDLLHDI